MNGDDLGREICFYLEGKQTLFDRYLVITECMKEDFRDKEPGELNHLFSERQDCMGEIEKVDGSINDIMKAGKEKTHPVSKGFKRLIGDHLRNLKKVMETIDLMDRELMVVAKEEGERLKRELLKAGKIRIATRGYRNRLSPVPRFLDTRT